MGNNLSELAESYNNFSKTYKKYEVQNKELLYKEYLELREIAKNLNIRGYSYKRKHDLIEHIDKVQNNHVDSKKLLYPKDSEIEALNVKQLRAIAKVLKIEKYYNCRREELIDLIKNYKLILEKPFPKDVETKKVVELKQIAKEYKIRGYSYINGNKSIRKADLIKLILQEEERLKKLHEFNLDSVKFFNYN